MSRWSTFTSGILNGLDWTNVFCAGGAVLANLVADNSSYGGSDIDLFLYGLDSDEAANAKLREIHALVVRNTGGRGDVIRTARAVTILNAAPYRHLQVVLRVYKSPAEVLLGFDIDSCTVGFDGQNVYCMERFKRAMTKRYNLVNISRRSLTYEQRLYKYSRRGFAVAVPNLDKSRVNPDILKKSLKEVFGLSKLLLYDSLSQQNIERTRRAGANPGSDNYIIRHGEQSDYNGELNIPMWNQSSNIKGLLHILKVRDHRHFFGQLQKMKKAEAAGQAVEKKRPEHLFETIFLDSAGTDGSAQPKIAWIRNNPAYQDIDGGFTRPLMTGSFNLPPPIQAIWDLESYASHPTNVSLSSDAGYVPGETPAPSATSFSFGSPKKSSPGPATFGSYSPASTGATVSGSGNNTRGGFMSYQGTGSSVSTAGQIDLSAFGGPSGGAPLSGFGMPAQATSFGSPQIPTSFIGAGATKSPAVTPYQSTGVSFGPSKFSVAKKGVKKEKSEKTEKTPHFTTAAASGPSSSGASSSFAPYTPAAASHTSASTPAHVSAASIALLLQEFASLRHFITDALKNSSTLQHASGQDEAPPTTKLLLLVTLCFKQGSITSEEKATLKDLIIDRNEGVFAALEVFEIDQDLSELVDTFKRVIKSANNNH